jgi:hypothetical protein
MKFFDAQDNGKIPPTTLVGYDIRLAKENVLFSDEVHFGFSDEGGVYIKRRIGTRSDPQHIQYLREPRDRDRETVHYWAYDGWNFKLDICFYDSRNKNDKMTQKAYIKQILKPFIKPFIRLGAELRAGLDGRLAGVWGALG